MHTLFNEPSKYALKSIPFARYDFFLKKHRKNLYKTIRHYRTNDYAVKSNHLLVRIIQTLPTMRHLNLRDYKDAISDYTPRVSQALRLTNPVGLGATFFPGVFLGVDSEEVIITTTEEFDINWLMDNWEYASPIRFIRHPKSDLNLNMPLGRSTSDENGPSVILINIPLLACQYRLWREREESREKNEQRTTMQYVISYPLANSLSSFQDIALLNRLIKLFNNEEVSDDSPKHPFALLNYHSETDGCLKIIINKILLKRRLSFTEIISIIKLVNKESIREAISIPDMPFTRQVMWGLIVARVPIITFFLNHRERVKSNFDKDIINTLRISIRRITSDKTIDRAATSLLTDATKIALNEDIEPHLK